jgi:uncharacterized protein YndB with AHSA1/START domain
VAAKRKAAGTSGTPELVITRVFDAPPALVFKAWTEPERLAQWWGPKGFQATSRTVDARPGGAWRIGMRSPEGKDHWARGVYREVVDPERLVFTFAWEEPEGRPGREMLVTLTFAEERGRTRLTFHQAPFETVKDRDEHREGWSESLDRLAKYLTKA